MQIGNVFYKLQSRCRLLAERNFHMHHKHYCPIAQEEYINMVSYYNADSQFWLTWLSIKIKTLPPKLDLWRWIVNPIRVKCSSSVRVKMRLFENWNRIMFILYLIRIFLSVIILRCIKGFVICPYCDPEHDPYPNIKEAMRGYDVPMGDPNPAKGNYDPGVRSQIFMPTIRNKDAYYKLDMSFITANSQIKVRNFWKI